MLSLRALIIFSLHSPYAAGEKIKTTISSSNAPSFALILGRQILFARGCMKNFGANLS